MPSSARSRSSSKMWGRFAWVLGALLALTACEDGSSKLADAAIRDAASPDGAIPTLDAAVVTPDAGVPVADSGEPVAGDLEADYCAPLADYVCSEADRCGCGVLLPSGELDRAGCIARWTQKCLTAYSLLSAAVESGLARVSRERAEACAALIEARTPACEHARGSIPFALCTPFVFSDEPLDDVCAGFPWCAGGEGVCSESTCLARAEEGEACQNEASCATPLACLEGKCRVLGTAGTTCQADEQCVPELRCVAGKCSELAVVGADCSEQAACARGLVCSGAPTGKCSERPGTGCDESNACGNLERCGAPRQCSPRLGKDEPCVTERDCLPALYCGAARTCVERPPLGEPCGEGVSCAVGLGCDPSGVAEPACIELPGDGEACALGVFGPLLCAEGLGCTDGLCGPLPAEAEPCTSDSRCAAGLACDFTANGSFCVAPHTTSFWQSSPRALGATAHCGSIGTCETDQPDGTPCSAGNECSGVCTGDDTAGFSCQPARAQGDSCVFDDECPDTTSCRAKAESARCLPEVCGDL